MEERGRQEGDLINYYIQKIYPVLQIGCYKQMMSLICQTTYPACERYSRKTGSECTRRIVREGEERD